MTSEQVKWTPGPWRLEVNKRQGEAIIRGKDGYCISSHDFGELGEEELANARLIALAPEMAEALQALVAMVRDSRVDDGATWTEDDAETFARAEAVLSCLQSA